LTIKGTRGDKIESKSIFDSLFKEEEENDEGREEEGGGGGGARLFLSHSLQYRG
jgi:hypothetical protein